MNSTFSTIRSCLMLLITACTLLGVQPVKAKLTPGKISFQGDEYAKVKQAESLIGSRENGCVYDNVEPEKVVGQYFDQETNLIENRNRFYDTGGGRYLQPDPIGLAGGMHRYNYTAGDPINKIDPLGLLFGGLVNAGESYGESSAQYWANASVNSSGVESGAYAVMGGLASLWTSNTSDKTFTTLSVFAGIARTTAVKGAQACEESLNLASTQRTKHILYGDITGGGHKFGFSRFFNGKDKFPSSWSNNKIMNAVSDIATDPSLKWVQQTGKPGSLFTKAGNPARFTVEGIHDGTTIKVVIEPAGEGIITAFPIR